jgi:hypothetical protein
MVDDNFENWTTSDLLFELKLERTLIDSKRKERVDEELLRRQKIANEQEEVRRNKPKSWLEKKLVDWNLKLSFIFIVEELILFSNIWSEGALFQKGGFWGAVIVQSLIVITLTTIYCIYHAKILRRWGWFLALSLTWYFSVPLYLFYRYKPEITRV